MKRPDLLRGERQPRAPSQRRSLLRREAVLQAALVRFGREGYERASVRGIAREADVATGAVYQFFGSKRHLLLVSMDVLLAHLEQVGPPPLASGGQRLLAGLEEFVEDVFSRERPFAGAYRAWQEAALTDATIAAHDRQVRAWSRARVRRLFGILASLPQARPGLDLALLAQLWDRFFWNLLAHPPAQPRRAARSVAATLYHALFLDSPAERERAVPRR